MYCTVLYSRTIIQYYSIVSTRAVGWGPTRASGQLHISHRSTKASYIKFRTKTCSSVLSYALTLPRTRHGMYTTSYDLSCGLAMLSLMPFVD